MTPDPLRQLIQALSRQAQADQSTGAIADDPIYIGELWGKVELLLR